MTGHDLFSIFIVCVVTNSALNFFWRSREPSADALNAKIDYLYSKTGVTFDPVESVAPDIRSALERGQKIVAIKLYRQATGCGLRQAKDAVENFTRSDQPPKAQRGVADFP